MISAYFKKGLTIIVFISLLAYHLTNVYIVNKLKTDWFSIVKLIQLASATAGLYLLLGCQFLAKLIHRVTGKIYLGGEYEGYSQKVIIQENKKRKRERKQKLYFNIKQSLLESSIMGLSYDQRGNQLSSWSGPLYSIEGNDFYFALHLVSVSGEYGVLKITYNNGSIKGIYWSGDQAYPGLFEVSAKLK